MSNNSKTPDIKPHNKTDEYHCKQSKYSDVAELPTRALILGPSHVGKSILLQNFILDIYKDCFNKVYIFSPSIDIDPVWVPVKEYLDKHLNTDKDDKVYFSEYDPEALGEILETQRKIVQYQKQHKMKKIFQICIIIDDWAESAEFVRHSRLLISLFLRGRHSFISTIVSSQVYRNLAPSIRKNATHLYIFRMRNQLELDAIAEEVSGVYDKKTILKMYKQCVDIPYNFLYINFMAKDIRDMFWCGLKSRLKMD